ncbi:putative thioesterase family protein [Diaporthe ampelina]|uniref:Putative thioesterase family protein n=1 Tax=Diaporthe ampelina TaxID=1214573 RepID=A0A0G2HWH1_9PEZI|nr:putative thioesterase family protein [Diaporthe ampelina]
MSDTLLRNGGLYDAHVFQQRAEQWAQEHPGVTCQTTNTLAEAVKSVIFNHTLTIDIEYKKALPKEGLRFVLMRTAANVLSGGRMQVEVALCNEDMELVATVRQSILVLEASRKFDEKRRKSAKI